jgi:large subunit ribosomal protein L16
MLQPKRIKYRKAHRGRMTGKAQAGSTIAFGEYAIKAMEPAWITARQIEAGRRAITRYLRRGGNVWIRVFPDKPVTKKPAETRQGSGKGPVDQWVAVVRPGRIIYEVAGVPMEIAREALRLASHKLPINVRIISQQEIYSSQGAGD